MGECVPAATGLLESGQVPTFCVPGEDLGALEGQLLIALSFHQPAQVEACRLLGLEQVQFTIQYHLPVRVVAQGLQLFQGLERLPVRDNSQGGAALVEDSQIPVLLQQQIERGGPFRPVESWDQGQDGPPQSLGRCGLGETGTQLPEDLSAMGLEQVEELSLEGGVLGGVFGQQGTEGVQRSLGGVAGKVDHGHSSLRAILGVGMSLGAVTK